MGGSAGGLLFVAAQGKSHGGTDFLHSRVSKLRDTPAQALLRYSHQIVKVDGAGALQAVAFIQPHFRRNAANGGSDGRHGRGRQVVECAVAGQYNHWPGFARRSKTVKPHIASGYSSGQIASASQPDGAPESLEPVS